MDASGRVLNGRYQLYQLVGGGGMAQLYQARDLKLNRVVAVKVLRDLYVSDHKFVQRFEREAQAAAGLSHPNIVGIYDVGEDNGLHYIVMDYVHGEALKARIARAAPLPWEEAARIAIDVLAALEHAHRNGLVHRDITPGNILIIPNGTVKVVDFGIARGTSDLTLTGTGLVMGTAAYMSPEQARGDRVGPQSDLYSLGVTLYEMLVGKPPFESQSDVGMAIKHLSEKPVPPRQVNPGIPPQLDAIVMRALEKDPARRFSAAAEMAQALRTISASVQLPTIASPAGANFVPPAYHSSGPNAPTHRMPLPSAMSPLAQPYPGLASPRKSNKDGAIWIAGGLLVLMVVLFAVILLPGLLRPQAGVSVAPTALATTAVLAPTETTVYVATTPVLLTDTELVAQAIRESVALNSYHFVLNQSLSDVDGSLLNTNVEGDYVSPDRVYEKGIASNVGTVQEYLFDRNRIYFRDPDSNWTSGPLRVTDGYGLIPIPDRANIAQRIKEFIDASNDYQDTHQDALVNGVQTRCFSFRTDPNKIGSLVFGPIIPEHHIIEAGIIKAGLLDMVFIDDWLLGESLPSPGGGSLCIDPNTQHIYRFVMNLDALAAYYNAVLDVVYKRSVNPGSKATPIPIDAGQFTITVDLSRHNDPNISIEIPPQ